eukprot:1155569-Pelagomonas_calceolata.AAC.1
MSIELQERGVQLMRGCIKNPFFGRCVMRAFFFVIIHQLISPKQHSHEVFSHFTGGLHLRPSTCASPNVPKAGS